MPHESHRVRRFLNFICFKGWVTFSNRACRPWKKDKGEWKRNLDEEKIRNRGRGGASSSGHRPGGLAGIGAPHEGKSPARTAPGDIGPGPGTFANNMYVQQPGMCWVKVLILDVTFGYGGQPSGINAGCWTYIGTLCTIPRGQSSSHRALAHLLAAHSIATPKQAREPTFPPATRDELVTDNWKTLKQLDKNR